MAVGQRSRHPPARRAIQEAALDQEWLVDLLDGLHFLADGGGNGVQSHRPAAVFFDDGQKQLAVHLVEPKLIDLPHVERLAGDRGGDAAVGPDLGVIADPPQQPVDNPRGAAAALRDLGRALRVHFHLEDRARALGDGGQVFRRVVIEVQDDAEAGSQGAADQAGARGGPDEGEGRQLQGMCPRARPLPDQHVHPEIFKAGVEDLFDFRLQPVHLIHKEHLPLRQLGEDAGQVSLDLNDRAGGLLETDAQLVGDDRGQRGLAQPGRAVDQHVVQRVAARARRLDGDSEVLLDLPLARKLGQQTRAQTVFEAALVLECLAADDPFFRHDRLQVAGGRLEVALTVPCHLPPKFSPATAGPGAAARRTSRHAPAPPRG